MKKIAVINDISGFGKCSLSAALPIISAHGVQCCPLPTGVYSNQTDFDTFYSLSLTEHIKAISESWKRLDISFDGILTGFIASPEQGRLLCDFIDTFKTEDTVVLVDPVMGDGGRLYSGYGEDSIKAVKALADKADIITPNVTELSFLTGKACGSMDEIEKQCRSFTDKTVIVTGIEEDGMLSNAVYSGGEFKTVSVKKTGGSFSGTGDIFSAFVLSEIISGKSVFEAVKSAADFIERAICETLKEEPEQPYHPHGIAFEKLLGITAI
jgi:pyridoxine kinase